MTVFRVLTTFVGNLLGPPFQSSESVRDGEALRFGEPDSFVAQRDPQINLHRTMRWRTDTAIVNERWGFFISCSSLLVNLLLGIELYPDLYRVSKEDVNCRGLDGTA